MNEEDGTGDSSSPGKIVETTVWGTRTVFLKDVSGLDGGKAGTSKMEWADPQPRNIPLRKKHRKG
jgi:hypothetical protein